MANSHQPKKWIGVMFSCCNYYGRAYYNDKYKDYRARCPKCGGWVYFTVGEGGTDKRFFEAL